jgi:hypothetical protein
MLIIRSIRTDRTTDLLTETIRMPLPINSGNQILIFSDKDISVTLRCNDEYIYYCNLFDHIHHYNTMYNKECQYGIFDIYKKFKEIKDCVMEITPHYIDTSYRIYRDY